MKIPRPPSKMNDTELLNWLEQHQCAVRYREYLPGGLPTKEPWWVCRRGSVPQTGATLRRALRSAIRTTPKEIES